MLQRNLTGPGDHINASVFQPKRQHALQEELLRCGRKGLFFSGRSLIELGCVDVSWARDKDKRTALMWSCRNGHMKMTELLLVHGADAGMQDSLGRTALIFAARNGHVELLAELLFNFRRGLIFTLLLCAEKRREKQFRRDKEQGAPFPKFLKAESERSGGLHRKTPTSVPKHRPISRCN